MGVDTRLSRLVVVRGHDQQAVHTNLFGTVRQLNGVRGVVRTNTGNNLRARTDGILHNLEDALVLVIGHGGVFTGGTADHQTIVAVLHKVVRQVCDLLFINGAVLREGVTIAVRRRPKTGSTKVPGFERFSDICPEYARNADFSVRTHKFSCVFYYSDSFKPAVLPREPMKPGT